MKGLRLGLSLTGDVSLGAEMVVNGGFDTNTDWSAATDGAISGGTYNWTATAGTRTTTNSSGTLPTAGRTYRVTFTLTSISAGSVQIGFGGTFSTARASAGTYTEDLVAANTTRTQNRAVIGTTASVDNVSVKEVL